MTGQQILCGTAAFFHFLMTVVIFLAMYPLSWSSGMLAVQCSSEVMPEPSGAGFEVPTVFEFFFAASALAFWALTLASRSAFLSATAA